MELVGWFDGSLICWFVGRSVGKSVSQSMACSVASLFHFQDAKIEIEAIAVVGEIVDSTS
jgi:hypothetical protein